MMIFNLDTQKQDFLDFITMNPGCNICYDGTMVTVTLPVPQDPLEVIEE